MSWSISTTIEDFRHAPEGLQKAHEILHALVPTGNDQAPEERNEQCKAAINTAYNVIRYGGFENAETIFVSLSGHANKEHKQDPEWANEFISVQVHTQRYRVE